MNKKFELEDADAAIIIKPDMTTELVIPKMDDDAEIKFDENQNIFITLAIGACMGDDDFRKLIQVKLDSMFENIEPVAADDSCDPDEEGPGCGGCKGCG